MSAIAKDNTIGVHDLKVHLSSVLDEVSAGRVVTITRHGHVIARIHPAEKTKVSDRRAAVERMKRARMGRKPGISATAAISEGRP